MFDKCWIPSSYPVVTAPKKAPAKAKPEPEDTLEDDVPKLGRGEMLVVNVELKKRSKAQPSLQVFTSRMRAIEAFRERVKEQEKATIVTLTLVEPGQDLYSDGQVLASS